MEEAQATREHDRLTREMKAWRYGVYMAMAAVAGAYLIRFGVILGQSLSEDAQAWGSFGDFFGGLLNPLVAFAALYWLTESVKIQKQELAETREELAAQAKNGENSVRLSAVTTIANLHLARMAAIERRLENTSKILAEPAFLDGSYSDDQLRAKEVHERFTRELLTLEDEHSALVGQIRAYMVIPDSEGRAG